MHAALGQGVITKEIKGRIFADSVAVDKVNVVNFTTQKATVSDAQGNFILSLKTGDIIVFSAVNLETLRRKVTDQDLLQEILQVVMHPKSIILKEVLINESAITAESLGIIPYGQKKYTAAERKLYTATSGGGIDGLLNSISGRKAMLKKEIIVEKKVQLLARMDVLYEEQYYLETLKIPLDYIKGFQYYCIDDADFANALIAKNKTLTLFLVVKLAENYKQIIAVENK
ncbi:carboxypeptidase-like regulatory domain-containing protein [Flavobacterium sp. P4023]|uniref:Carboxypeptidase-like regulatory domain-containing protein n=2 Tax=Flavobacterium flabelliforme TaxID=2816119 RepID=A0ABS5CPZ7_9FLAO|nr:carboxypeptidase-like regulatory domain-containing protein [Flavobacterium flabelliforme]